MSEQLQPKEALEETTDTLQAAEETESADKKGKKGKDKPKKSAGRELLEWILTILVAVCIALPIRAFVFELVKVDGSSMNDTLVDGEVMLVSKLGYTSVWLTHPFMSDEAKEDSTKWVIGGSPSLFDVVICHYPGRGDTNFVKRVVGLPGDTVELRDGYLYVNGVKYDEPYVSDAYRTTSPSNGYTFAQMTVPKAGDAVTVAFAEGSQTRLQLRVNGEAWRWPNGLYGVAADGTTLQLESSTLTINGEVLTTVEEVEALSGKEFYLQQDSYMVMGDHRNNSNDARAIGPITRDMLLGHVKSVIWPIGSWRGIAGGESYAAAE